MIPRKGKPRLYIDVDGVLFGFYGEPEEFQLRPGVSSFLRWANENFECRWLTSWFDKANALVRDTYFNLQFPVARWGSNKTEGIDFATDWYWIDDDNLGDEQRILDARECRDRFILVDAHGADALAVVRRQLELKLKHGRIKRIVADAVTELNR